jgi:3-methyl-2-oxobutanoate hydroxymethyltransferase
MARRVTSSAVRARKGASFPVITAYDAPFARIAEAAGVDVLLVGDSLGMVVLGYDSTMPVTLDDMLRHGGAVVRGTTKAHVMIDLPFGSYQASDELAVTSAIAAARVGATSVKMEVSLAQMARVRAVVDAGVPVCAHIGVLPQVAAMTSGFRKQSAHDELLATAKAAEAAGAFVLVMEMVDAEVAAAVTRAVAIPTIGIGSGQQCDAQVLVMHDVLGLYGSPPPFSRTFADIADVATRGIAAYAQAVRDRTFPSKGAMTNDEASHIYGAHETIANVTVTNAGTVTSGAGNGPLESNV